MGPAAIRVLLTTPCMEKPGGVSRYWKILRSHLPDDVQYFEIGSRSDKEGKSTLLRVVRDSWGFVKTLKRGEIDVVHLNPSILPKSLVRDGILLLLAKLFGKKVLVFAHGWNPAWDSRFPTGFPFIFRTVYGKADAFMVLGKQFEKQLRHLGFKKPVLIEVAPVADDLLTAVTDDRSRGHLTSDRFKVLFLGRVEKEKGIYEALDAYSMLKQKHRCVSLTVAGDGSELDKVRRYADAHALADVSFVGHVEGSEKAGILKMANAYLFPSYHEGLPLSVLEAMACGLPIVTSAVGGLKDFFVDGAMGFIAPGRDPQVLAASLDRLIRNPKLCSDISAFNRAYALANFRADRLASRILRVYRLLLGLGDEAHDKGGSEQLVSNTCFAGAVSQISNCVQEGNCIN